MSFIPEQLRQDHEDGNVIFFCGAGVSMPAGLPSFKGLVEQVLEELEPSKSNNSLLRKAFIDNKFDEVLGILERHTGGGYGREVRATVSEILRTKLELNRLNLDSHTTLCRLAGLNRPDGRLITTNFDPLFENALARLRRKEKFKHQTLVEIAPALSPPKPEDWASLVYLHGRLDHSPDNTNLVLTTADFGKAYLLDGWARRAVIELFRHFYVVFIGYSIEDPTLRYLISAFAAARQGNEPYKSAYAFAPYGDENGEPVSKDEAIQAWDIKDVIPIPYDSEEQHKNLWQELADWANDYAGGLNSKFQKVTRYGRTKPADTPDEAVSELCWALKDTNVAQLVSNLEDDERLRPDWTPVLQEEGLFSLPIGKNDKLEDINVPLASFVLPDHQIVNQTTDHLGSWIAANLDSREVVDWVISQGGVLHRNLRRHVRHRLQNDSEIPNGFRKFWNVLASDDYAHALSAKNLRTYPYHPRLSPHEPGALRDFITRLRPIPVFTKQFRYFDEQVEINPETPSDLYAIKIHLIGIEGVYDIDRYRKRATDWDGAISSIAEDITSLLREAMDWQQEFELASETDDRTYFEMRSISEHEQNKYAKTWTLLIQLARESFDVLASNNPSAATRLVHRWQELNYPIFRRLVLYAATGGGND